MDGYVKFNYLGKTPSGKTTIWEVLATVDDAFLGAIKWSTGWRRYIFEPDDGCRFDATCLRTIQKFLVMLMNRRKEKS